MTLTWQRAHRLKHNRSWCVCCWGTVGAVVGPNWNYDSYWRYHIPYICIILVLSLFSPIFSSKPWLPVDESHALGNVNCKLNSCCCVHNKSANVTMNILIGQIFWGVWFRRHSWNTIGNDHDGGFDEKGPTLCLDVRLCEGCPQAYTGRSPPLKDEFVKNHFHFCVFLYFQGWKSPDLEGSCNSQAPAVRSDGRRFGAEMEIVSL